MKRIDEIHDLFRYNAWANRRAFAATSSLSAEDFTRDLGNSFPSVRDTLVHIVGAEWVWLQRWHGSSPTEVPNTKAALHHDEIAAWWDSIENDRRGYMLDLTDDALDRVIHYTNFAGKAFAFPLWQQMRHLANHSTYHRGQITTMLKQLGSEPLATDMILMYQEG